MSSQIGALYIGTLDVAGMKIPCAVLEDERRVVTEHAILTILGSCSGASKRIKYSEREKGQAHLPIFLAPKRLKPYINKHLSDGPMSTIEYRHKSQIVSSYDCHEEENLKLGNSVKFSHYPKKSETCSQP